MKSEKVLNKINIFSSFKILNHIYLYRILCDQNIPGLAFNQGVINQKSMRGKGLRLSSKIINLPIDVCVTGKHYQIFSKDSSVFLVIFFRHFLRRKQNNS